MARRHQRKRAVLFLAAVLLPSAVLVGTTLRLIRQQRELSVRRAQEERALLALRVGQELLDELNRVGDRLGRTPLSPQPLRALADSVPAILTLASVRNGRLSFPWEMESEPASSLNPARLTRYTRYLDRGEAAEYRSKDLVEAASWYGQAAKEMEEAWDREDGPPEVGRDDARHAAGRLLGEARIHWARVLLRAQRTEEARAIYSLLAETPPLLTDMNGMPFSIYGCQGLLQSGREAGSLLSLMRETLKHTPHFTLPAVLAWRDVAREIVGGAGDESADSLLQAVEEAVAARTATLRELENLRSDFPSLLATTRAGRESRAPPGAPTWLPYGQEPWVVGFLDEVEGSPARLAVVRPALLSGPGGSSGEGTTGTPAVGGGDQALWAAGRNMTFLPAGEAGGESLGPSLNGLQASFPPDFPPPSDSGGVEGWFFRLLLPVILLLTGFTAYLAWRDVRREAEAVRLRSQFVSSVTHELKTPLTSIRMFVETVRLGRHSSPEVQQEYLDTVVHETERLSRLINNVLDFARIDRGEKTYHMAPTDLAAAAREAARAVAYPLTQGSYTLITEIAEDLPRVNADGDALTQALLNLLSNAIKFSREGSRIDLRVCREGADVLLQVEDRGRGISPRDREAIFRDFVRTADVEEDGIPGTGLGLPLVAHVVRAHGGRVEVKSEVGQGSTFTLRIPVRVQGPEEGEAA